MAQRGLTNVSPIAINGPKVAVHLTSNYKVVWCWWHTTVVCETEDTDAGCGSHVPGTSQCCHTNSAAQCHQGITIIVFHETNNRHQKANFTIMTIILLLNFISLGENAEQLMQLTNLSTIGFRHPACAYFTSRYKVRVPRAGFIPRQSSIARSSGTRLNHSPTGDTQKCLKATDEPVLFTS
jgi:hypothetical protein